MNTTDSSVIATTGHCDTVSDDAALVVRAQTNRDAFGPLYQQYADLIFRYCYRRLAEQDAAADATSQIFVKAITGLGGCNPEKFRSWLFAIAHNVTIDSLRTRKPERMDDDFLEPVDHAPGPEEQAVRSDEGDRLREVISQLPPDQQRILELRLAGLSTVEIAESLGRTRGAIDTAQCRAVQRLRAIFNADRMSTKVQSDDSI